MPRPPGVTAVELVCLRLVVVEVGRVLLGSTDPTGIPRGSSNALPSVCLQRQIQLQVYITHKMTDTGNYKLIY